jgi:hypothetical protein
MAKAKAKAVHAIIDATATQAELKLRTAARVAGELGCGVRHSTSTERVPVSRRR